MRVALNFPCVGARRGGAETYVGVLARALDAAGHEVHVLARQVDEGELPPSVCVHTIRTRRLPGLDWLQPYQFAAASERELAIGEFDLVVGFAHLWRQDVCLAISGCRKALLKSSAQRFRSGPSRLLWRTGKLLSPKQWVYRWIEHKQFGQETPPFVIAPSHRVAHDFRRWHALADDQLAVVPLGIELSSATQRGASHHAINHRQAFRQRFALGPADIAILFAARNYSLKGLEPLLLSFAPVARECAEARLLVCGSDRDARFRRLAAELGLAAQVRFLGFVDDAQECFAGVDLFVLPTFYDACSLVVLEALAAGLPVVTTRANGAAELVSDGIDGYVVDAPWALDQLSDRMHRLVARAELRNTMSQQARTGAARLSIERSVESVLRVLVNRGCLPAEKIQRRAAA